MNRYLLAVSVLLCHAHCLLAFTLRLPRAVKPITLKNWIVYIENKYGVCAGVQVSDEWVLTLGDCVEEGEFSMYKVDFRNLDKRKVRAEERSPVDDLLVLLKIDKDSESDKDFTTLATTTVPAKYKFQVYNVDRSDKIKSYDVDFVNKKSCTKTGVEGNFGKKRHTCFKATIDKNSECVPGFPVFGTKNNKVVLQGLSTTARGSCSDKYQATVAIVPHQSWIEKILTDCGSLPKIKNGDATLDDASSTSAGATASISCDFGYGANKLSITCRETGEWENAKCKIKDCGSLPKIKNGDATLDDSDSTVGATASISCDSGYEANKLSITCKETGEWENAKYKIKDCGSLPKIKNGDATLENFDSTVGATASISCASGYDANKLSIKCKETGEWENAKCKIKDCGSLPTIQNGNATLDDSDSTVGSTASIRCDSGYEANKPSITCRQSGIWQSAKCKIRDCGSLPTIQNGNVTLDDSDSTVGSTASISCDSGYEANKPLITCKPNGIWQSAKCKIRDCGPAPSISDGSVSPSTTTYGSTAAVNCNPGYDSNQPSIKCQANGSWETPACIIKDRGSAPAVSNGTIILTSSTSTYGSTATVACDPGYDSNGATITCQASGCWETPIFTIKNCGLVPNVTDGTVSLTSTTTTYGSTASVTCDPGYDSKGATITCTASGSWDIPTCTIKDCGSVPSVSDGTVRQTANTSTYGSTASVTCDPGYDSNGATIACQASGSWEMPTCTIKDCGSAPSVSNGTVSLTATTTTYGSNASLTCDTGYDSNVATITCQDNGVWQTPTCTIKDCGFTPSVSNGTVSLTATTTTYGSTASVNCDDGHDSNVATITCQASGMWETPTCTIKDCGSTPFVSDGTVSLTANTTTYGSTASVTCDPGYNSNGATITCQASGSWETPICTIKDCGSAPSVSNGTVSLTATTTTYGSTASLTCDTGYDSNVATITCQDNGVWQTPTCTIKDCGFTPSVSNGTVSLTATTTTYGSTASVNCDDGHDSNVATITCQASGMWETPTCTIKDCGSTPFVSDGTVSLTANTTTYGSTASVICEPGYDSNGATITCQASGSWETPTCTIKECGIVPSVSNGTVILTSTTTTYGSTATVNCYPGYDSNENTITCQASGSWETPTCTIKDCGSVPLVSNGTVSLTSTTTTYGSTASVTCDSGYDSNLATITCQASGSWGIPLCTIKDCGAAPSISNGTVTLTSSISTTYGSTASVTCNSGYDSNLDTITCQASGSWETPTCTIKDCGAAPSVSDGTVTLTSSISTTYGSTASVTCNSGYDSNLDTITCQASGSWETPTCTIKDCGAAPSVSDGTVTLTSSISTTYGSTASVTCNSGYDSNLDIITCQASGSWETPTCTIKDCGAAPSVSDGTVTLTSSISTTYGSTASVTCNSGYDSNLDTITCQASGSWETPTCTIKDCGAAPSVSDGTVTLTSSTSTTYGSTASVTCNSGYDSNLDTITCQASGSWETPTCTIRDCGTPTVSDGTVTPDSSVTTVGSTASVTCIEGYEASKDSIECKTNGNWQNAKCTIVDCGSDLPTISDGVAILDDSLSTTYGSTATVTCDPGFSTSKTTLKCKANGSWSKTSCT